LKSSHIYVDSSTIGYRYADHSDLQSGPTTAEPDQRHNKLIKGARVYSGRPSPFPGLRIKRDLTIDHLQASGCDIAPGSYG
jgi:hypothetical protein